MNAVAIVNLILFQRMRLERDGNPPLVLIVGSDDGIFQLVHDVLE